jgi:hypothetical protein
VTCNDKRYAENLMKGETRKKVDLWRSEESDIGILAETIR